EMGEGTVVLGPQGEAKRKDASPIPPQPLQREPSGEGNPKWMKGAPSIPSQGIVIPAPPKDLFTTDPLAVMGLAQLAERISTCRGCGLCEGRQKTVPGEGASDARLVVVGEGPGATEDETGRPFVGRAGELLTEILAA